LAVDTGSVDLSTSGGAQSALDTVDMAIQSVATYRAKYGANQQRLQDIEAELLARLSGS
jgi:flagellin-like hook-associated protein FlgL